uniref:Uncharacterized protein n=1 Tax=Pristionchus pacificus TaxID=54126 RepID=A0A2A6CVY9_PRIPA|eukprot:PDM82181.1 hypothetical protein PRIPAC_36574 [Pristionchus pacificus]
MYTSAIVTLISEYNPDRKHAMPIEGPDVHHRSHKSSNSRDLEPSNLCGSTLACECMLQLRANV